MPRTDYPRLRLTISSKPIIVTIVFLSIFCFFSLSPFSVADGWAKDITLEWDPNTEPDIGGYIVHYGTESGIYDYSLDVGNFTSAVISGLDDDGGSTVAAGDGGGGGCFISSAESRSPGQSEANLADTLSTRWQKIKQMVSEFIVIRHLMNKPSL